MPALVGVRRPWIGGPAPMTGPGGAGGGGGAGNDPRRPRPLLLTIGHDRRLFLQALQWGRVRRRPLGVDGSPPTPTTANPVLTIELSWQSPQTIELLWEQRNPIALRWGLNMSIAGHITMFRSDDVTLRFNAVLPTGITGWTVYFQVRDNLGGTLRISKSTGGNGVTLADTGKGIIEVTLAEADTTSLSVGNYVWDLKRTDAGSNAVLAHGTLTLRQEVTT